MGLPVIVDTRTNRSNR